MNKVLLKDICNFEKGTTGLAKSIPGKFPLVATGANRRSCNSFQIDNRAVCIPLVSSTGHGHASLKNVHYQEGKFALGSILVALTTKNEEILDIQFLHLYLSELKDLILVPLMSGAANVALSVEKIKNIEIPLPSISRQIEIVAKFKSIVVQENKLKNELSYQHELLNKLRQQILQEAIEGKLTKKWRLDNPKVESASELLKSILVSKEKLIKEKILKKHKPLPPITEKEKPFDLPQGWIWCRLGEVSNYGQSQKVEPKDINNETWILELEDIEKTSSKILKKIKFKERKSKSTKSKFKKNDVLYGKLRPYLDKVIVAEEEGVCTTEIMPISLIGTLNPWFIRYSLKTPLFLRYVNSQVSGMRMPRLKTDSARSALIPIPPVLEQEIIVNIINKLFYLCDQLENNINKNKKSAEQLMKTVLKEEFKTNTNEARNVIPIKPRNTDYYKRLLLAAEITYQLYKEPTFGHLKLQKLIYLCERTGGMQLPTNFLQQAAGPYDPSMARSIDKQFKQKKWFMYQRVEYLKYKPLDNCGDHKSDFSKYFKNELADIQIMIDLFRPAKSDQIEIVATLYACWENIIKKQESFTQSRLIEDFYNWSDEKSKFERDRLEKAITWMTEKGIMPS